MPEQDNETNTQATDHRPGPLDGLLIADFSRVLAGPYCTMLLGDLGATVIKVESPSGDETRTWLPPDRNGVATYYLAINRNKRSITPSDGSIVSTVALRNTTGRPGGKRSLSAEIWLIVLTSLCRGRRTPLHFCLRPGGRILISTL